jgi:hypothetical protein
VELARVWMRARDIEEPASFSVLAVPAVRALVSEVYEEGGISAHGNIAVDMSDAAYA